MVSKRVSVLDCWVAAVCVGGKDSDLSFCGHVDISYAVSEGFHGSKELAEETKMKSLASS